MPSSTHQGAMWGEQRRVLRLAAASGHSRSRVVGVTEAAAAVAGAPRGRRPLHDHGGQPHRRGWPKGPVPGRRGAPRCHHGGDHGALGTSSAAVTTSAMAPQCGHRPTRPTDTVAGAVPAAAAATTTTTTETGGKTVRRTRGEGGGEDVAGRGGRARRGGRPMSPCSGRCRFHSGGAKRTHRARRAALCLPPLFPLHL